MKKLIAAALTLALAATMSVTAFAADNTTINQDSENKKGNTEVYFSVDPTYTVTIPGEVKLTYDEGSNSYTGSGDITTDAIRLGQGHNVTVTVAGDFEMKSVEDATLPYDVKIGNATTAIESNDTVATFGTSTTAQSVTLNYSAANPTYAGNYTDTLTFTISAPAIGENNAD